ncbi:TatD related DNase [Planctomycetes bacterium Poly30]|uniref:TatD related DNase n=1 Tax=Saltatorellus ferox TaxID=2528018 RepID=A0A518ESA6_9BACT|nr:TatD related DNase [Planctomycetes bacterium Poly30]
MSSFRFFDPHAHMTSRTTDDYERMAKAGVRALIEPAFWLGQPRTNVGSFVDYFSSLVGWERFRASQFGIQHFCAIGLNSKEANNEGLAKDVLEILPRFALKEGVVAIGEIGYDEITPAEERAYQWQLEFAREHDMVVMVHSPHRDKKRGIIRSIDVAKEVGIDMEKLVIDHNNEETVKSVLDAGAWAAFTIYPNTKMGSQRMVDLTKQYGADRFIVDSSCDWGVSDPLSVPKTAKMMLEQGVPADAVEKTTWKNAVTAYGHSGQIDFELLDAKPVIDQRQLFMENSVLRGQEAQVDEGVPN